VGVASLIQIAQSDELVHAVGCFKASTEGQRYVAPRAWLRRRFGAAAEAAADIEERGFICDDL
jgi:hypothetical protein